MQAILQLTDLQGHSGSELCSAAASVRDEAHKYITFSPKVHTAPLLHTYISAWQGHVLQSGSNAKMSAS